MITATSTETSGLKASYDPGHVWLIPVVAAMGGTKPFFQRCFELTAESQIGLGQKTKAGSRLQTVFRRDPNHAMAADLFGG